MKKTPIKLMSKLEPKKPVVVPKLKGPPKHYQQDGHWIVKPQKTAILVCKCGNRYLKTRPHQGECLRCMFGAK